MNHISSASVTGRRIARRKKNIRVYQAESKRSRAWACHRPADTARLAARLVSAATENVWLLRGPLGSGKSTFTRLALRALGYRGTAPSPTYTLTRMYRLRQQRWSRVLHVDAYRLRGPAEEAALDLEAAVADPDCLTIIEWPEKLRRRPWAKVLTLRFVHVGVGRKITASRAV